MTRNMELFAVRILVTCGLAMAGCNRASSPPATAPQAAESATGGESEWEKIRSNLAQLSPEDRLSAEKQAVCPVTGEKLGAMGPPEKVNVKGQEVWVCCSSCTDKLLEKPDAYLVKLKG